MNERQNFIILWLPKTKRVWTPILVSMACDLYFSNILIFTCMIFGMSLGVSDPRQIACYNPMFSTMPAVSDNVAAAAGSSQVFDFGNSSFFFWSDTIRKGNACSWCCVLELVLWFSVSFFFFWPFGSWNVCQLEDVVIVNGRIIVLF